MIPLKAIYSTSMLSANRYLLLRNLTRIKRPDLHEIEMKETFFYYGGEKVLCIGIKVTAWSVCAESANYCTFFNEAKGLQQGGLHFWVPLSNDTTRFAFNISDFVRLSI